MSLFAALRPAEAHRWLVPALVASALCAALEVLAILVVDPLAREVSLVFAALLMVNATFLLPACVLSLAAVLLEEGGLRLPVPRASSNLGVALGVTLTTVGLRVLGALERELNREFPVPVGLAATFAVVGVLLGGAGVALVGAALGRRFEARLEVLLPPRRLLALEGLVLLVLAVWVTQAGLAAVNDLRLLPYAAPCVLALSLFVVRAGLPGASRSGGVLRGPRAAVVVVVAVVLGAVAGALAEDARFVVDARAASVRGLLFGGRELTDLDGDRGGFALWGGPDCAPLDERRGAIRREVPGNGVDDDCRGGDAARTEATEASLPSSGPWATCLARVSERPRSILFITVDTLRADAVSRERTPSLAALAGASAWFTRAYSASTSTYLSLYALLGGRHISDAPNGSYAPVRDVPSPEGLLPALRAAGYRALAVPMLPLPDGLSRHFDVVTVGQRDPDPDSPKFGFSSSSVTSAALELLVGEEAPFFLWVHYLDPHAPFLPIAREMLPEPDGNAYEREVAYTFAQVGRLLEGLAASPFGKDTIIVLTADHGEGLGERGRHGHGPDLFESTIHVPLALHVPGCPPVLVEQPVSHTDVAPALALLAGAPLRRPFSLLDGVAGRTRPWPVVAETGFQSRLSRALIDGDHKLIVDVDGAGALLFDLAADPDERTSRYGDDEALTARMQSLYQRWLDRPLVVDEPAAR